LQQDLLGLADLSGSFTTPSDDVRVIKWIVIPDNIKSLLSDYFGFKICPAV